VPVKLNKVMILLFSDHIIYSMSNNVCECCGDGPDDNDDEVRLQVASVHLADDCRLMPMMSDR
jgi:hypothetical protein